MEFGIGIIIGGVLGSVWTGWVFQRAVGRRTVIPTLFGSKKAKTGVHTPTEYERSEKNKELQKKVKQLKRAKAEKDWEEVVGASSPLMKFSKNVPSRENR